MQLRPGLNSDIDYLYQNNELKIITDLSDCEAGELYLYMSDDGHTHPGYVKLHPITLSSGDTLVSLHDYSCTLDSSGLLVLPNACFHWNDMGFRTGPAAQVQNGHVWDMNGFIVVDSTTGLKLVRFRMPGNMAALLQLWDIQAAMKNTWSGDYHSH
ncbi:hypothetical protein CHS0354_002626 [Potamilus streckersoni]|uniref:Uncharacterized protein n=1 Tax=Potamilus streckersoni TaxID=2493646 RepID=A0AAE0RNS0_9BIVA|nr:hypothetical protein CHS0354_002626 [Potamilus streckersoni]